ncbi:MAG: hypothetical protein OXU69_12335 [Gemmatimonadota bacterium]|nr:hypothetical protein [Gemmatimonadota bacterium]MDE2985485.1 hypothetical protein [Gemmatimonadota bacterium]
MSTPNRAAPVLPVRRPLAMKLLLLACALTVMSCRDDPRSGAHSDPGTRHLPEEPGGVAGTDVREATLETRRPAEEPAVAAGEADEREDQVPHRDSDNTGLQDRLQRWSLSEEPSVVIGGGDEREGYLLHHVVGAVRLGDGRIVIANLSSLELKYYDPEGRHLFDAGGRGDGPGEFRSFDQLVRLPGDSILVLSWHSGLTRFGRDGQYASSSLAALPPRGRCWYTEGQDYLLSDGSILLRYASTAGATPAGQPCLDPHAGRPPAVIGRYVPATGDLDTIAVVPGVERTEDPTESMHAYPRHPVVAVAHDRIHVGETGSGTILSMTFRGDTVAALPVPFEPAVVPRDAKERQSDGGSLFEGVTSIYPDFYPRYARLVAAPGDRLWVMAYPPLKQPVISMELDDPVSSRRLDEGAWWKVIGPNGLPIAELRTPPRFFLLEVGDDHVLGISMDGFLRESVEVYRLIR